jgi:hypothetical protein
VQLRLKPLLQDELSAHADPDVRGCLLARCHENMSG